MFESQFMKVQSILQGKCPRCNKAHIFKTFWTMHKNCPNCDILYEREPGYFTMAIFVGYMLALLIALPGLILTISLGLPLFWIIFVPCLCIAIAAPWIFRYARIIWIHSDQWMDPPRD